jgi:hypothetical protein
MPALPPLQLQEFLPVLEALAAKLPQPTEAEQRELKELGDIALQLVDADPRTAGRAERTLLEHPRASFVLEPALQHTEIATCAAAPPGCAANRGNRSCNCRCCCASSTNSTPKRCCGSPMRCSASATILASPGWMPR